MLEILADTCYYRRVKFLIIFDLLLEHLKKK